jgi:hypothetical protein
LKTNVSGIALVLTFHKIFKVVSALTVDVPSNTKDSPVPVLGVNVETTLFPIINFNEENLLDKSVEV